MKITINDLLSTNEGVTTVEGLFYTEDSPEGYTDKVSFHTYLNQQKQLGGTKNWRIIHIKNFFESAKAGRRLVRMPESVWEDGERWMWCKFTFGKVTQNLKIADGGGMHKLISDYAIGRVKITYDLADLLQEAAA